MPLLAQAEQQHVIGPFSGLNNSDNSAAIPEDKAQDLLNVDLALAGKSVKKREGFGLAYALTITTSPVHGVYDFFDGPGNDVALAFNDTRMTASVNGASSTVLFSSGPFGATYQCTDSQGFAYCVNTNRDHLIKTNGVTYTFVYPASTGTIVSVTPDRLVLSGFSEAPNRVDFSAAADFTSWTTGVAPTSAFSFTITAPGSKITHLTYAFNRIFWFKDNSFGYILQGQTAADWVVQVVSPNVGTLDNTSVFDKGILYFRAQDSHIYSYDGSNLVKLTRDLGTTVSASQSRASNSWTQTSQSDFAAGASTPTLWISTTVLSNSIVLDTAPAVSPFLDSVSTDFGAGFSFTNVDTTTFSGSILLSKTSTATIINRNPGTDTFSFNLGCGANIAVPQVGFTVNSSSLAAVLTFRLLKTGTPGNYQASISPSNTGSPFSSLGTINSSLLTAGTTANITVNLSSFYPLMLGVTYYPSISNGSSCDSSNYVSWVSTAVSLANMQFSVAANSFNSSGTIISRSFDTGLTTNTWIWNWSNFYATGTIPSGSTVTYETQTSSASVGAFDSIVSVSSGSQITSVVKEFIRYKVTFANIDGSTSPVLTDVMIFMTNRIRPGATYYSAVRNAPNITTWDSFQITSQNNGGTQLFSIRSSTNIIQVLSSTPTWTAISPGAVPSISTGTYFQIADAFLVTNATQNPTLNDFTQNWFEGQAADKAYATYFKDAIWFSVASGTGATTNNRILRFDLLNQTWLLYDIPINGFYVRNTNLYFGSATGGYVYKFGGSNSDNGSAINAFWKSKDFFGDSPFTDSDIPSLSLFFSAIANSSMTVTYTIGGSSSTAYTVPLYRTINFGGFNRAMPLGTSGNTFNVRFGNNAIDQPFEVFSIQYGTVEKPWRPGNQ